jgi:hypothetical protein
MESLRPRAYSTSYVPDPEKGTAGEADEDNDLVGEPEVIAPNEHGADIVDHLDVIGMYRLLLSRLICLLNHCRSSDFYCG